MKKGKLVAFEGIDGAGKSTQISLIKSKLEGLGYTVFVRREPTSDGPDGIRLRQSAQGERYPVEEEFQLFLKDRQWNAEAHTIPAMKAGKIVFLDRYYLSSMAYQGARGMDPEFIRIENEKIAPRPDLVFLFELPLEESLRRIQDSRPDGADSFESEELLRKVKTNFDAMNWPEIVRVDATQSVEEIASKLLAALDDCLES